MERTAGRKSPGAPRGRTRAARARAEFDLAIVSVLLDAGAGPDWRYADAQTGQSIGRSEGLALASLVMFADGLFSARGDDPLRVDADALRNLSLSNLCNGPSRSHRPIPWSVLKAALALLQRLGEVLAACAAMCSAAQDSPRPGGLADRLALRASGGRLVAPTILSELLVHLGPIWPSRLSLGGVPLGDCWRHPALTADDATNGLVPLHKLSQWLAYSLIEPLKGQA